MMLVKDKIPEKILVSTDFLKSAISKDKDQKDAQKDFDNGISMALDLGGAFVSCVLGLLSSWNVWGNGLRIIMMLFSLIFGVFTLWYIIKLIQAKMKLKKIGKNNLDELVINEAKEKIRYTALLIICYQNKEGVVKFITEKQGNYIVHCDMEREKSIKDQKERIINYLATTYNVHRNYVEDIIPLSTDPFFSIKPIHGTETQNGFVFFQIKLRKKAKQNLLNHKDVEAKSIQEMEAMSELMGRNQDIVMALDENKAKIIDSFEDTYGPIHVIWNITKKCPYACKICATRDDSRIEISTEEKLKVLDHIFSAKEHIGTLDFAGGDPMYDGGIRTVIMQAINSLGEERVSVTTTGKGIQAMENISDEEISKLLGRCEITIDASHENLAKMESTFSRKSPEYCEHNYLQIQNASENLQNLVINIPLLDDELSDEEISNLMFKLMRLKENYSELEIEVQIIRLMPVGAFNSSGFDKNRYRKYQPIDLAKKIKAQIEMMGISCRYHCSLRVLPQMGECDERCNMLEKKIGIDCSGNVFACTWGAYLSMPDNDVSQNPFYLGNLVSTSLKKILDGQGVKTFAYKRISSDIQKHNSKPYCEAVSWYFKNVLDENNDPLST